MIETILNVVVDGLLIGGIYALIAVGLSLQYGVAKVLNIAHGEFIMLGGFITWTSYKVFGINPLLSVAICGPLIFVLGFVLHLALFKRIRMTSETEGAFEGNSMLACFGLMFIIQNVAILIWGAGIKGYSYLGFPVSFGGGAVFPANRLTTLAVAVIICIVFYLFLSRSHMGKGIRAAAQDPDTAQLVGVDINRVLALCFGFGALMAGLAGTLVSMCYKVEPTMGLEYTIIAIIVVVLGGMGSILGSFLGGILLGLIGSLVSHIEPGLTLASFYLIFMILLLVKPTGIFGK
ncbi:MAG: branched-chain amino acid ABC transporter permease [Desulfobacteraceae bacterium]|nr:branched-chain amino acid ABC transporter permease [Desulfobacteraceae bacterium]